MFGKKSEKIYPREARKRKNFFEKKREEDNSAFSRFVFRFLALVFVSAVIYILFFSPFLEVNNISLEGINELSYEDVHNRISWDIQGKYLKFIPQNNLILVIPGIIKRDLLNDFKKLSEVKVEKIFPNGIKVAVKERKSLLVWCSAGPCYIIDENGYAYTGADFESEEVRQNNLVSLVDISAKPVIMGEKILLPEYINFASNIKDELERDTGIKITSEYQTQSRVAEEVKVKTEEGWDIYFSSALPLEESVRTLSTFLEKEIPEDKRNNLEYVDLRAENKVYYKMRTDTEVTQTNADQTQTDAEKKDDKKKKN